MDPDPYSALNAGSGLNECGSATLPDSDRFFSEKCRRYDDRSVLKCRNFIAGTGAGAPGDPLPTALSGDPPPTAPYPEVGIAADDRPPTALCPEVGGDEDRCPGPDPDPKGDRAGIGGGGGLRSRIQILVMNEAEEKPNLYYLWPELIFEKMGQKIS